MIHLRDKRFPNAGTPRFVDVLIGVEMNFLLLEGADESLSIPVLSKTPAPGNYGNLNAVMLVH